MDTTEFIRVLKERRVDLQDEIDAVDKVLALHSAAVPAEREREREQLPFLKNSAGVPVAHADRIRSDSIYEPLQ